MRLRTAVYATGWAGVLLLGCASQAPEGGPRSARGLAAAAVQSALDDGTFEAMLNQAIGSAFSVAKARVEGTGRTLTLEQSRHLEAVLRKVLTEVFPRAAWEEALVPVYLEPLDREELEQVLEFQRTPFGRKLMSIHARLITGGGAIDRLMKSREAELTKRLAVELDQAWKPVP